MDGAKFYVSTSKVLLNVDLIYDFLKNESYWAQNRTLEVVKCTIENSLCFGVYTEQDVQVGFARVVTDGAVFAWVMDVFVVPDFRGRGLGKRLMGAIRTFDGLQGIVRWGLAMADAHGLYKQFGFSNLSEPESFMEMVISSG